MDGELTNLQGRRTMHNFGFWERASIFAVAAALLFAANKVHRSSGKHSKATKPAGVVMAFIAGLAFLVTFVGTWLGDLTKIAIGFGAAGLIICVAIIACDWLFDGKPDRAAFYAAFFLALFIVVGVSQLPAVGRQIGDGGRQVTDQMGQLGK